MPNKGGRPPKTGVDPLLAKAICDNLEIAMPLTLAAEAEGIHRDTIYDWIKRFPEFARQVTRAKAVAAKKLSEKAQEGGKGSSQATWFLERRYYDDYGPPRHADVSQPSEVRITIEGGLPKSPQ
jgi:hypothetical protein